jgi:hypothetical protein
MITQRNSINNELRITIRHEIEHYYQSINKLLYRIKKEYELRLKDNSLSNVVADCHNMIEHYILSDENIKGFGIAIIIILELIDLIYMMRLKYLIILMIFVYYTYRMLDMCLHRLMIVYCGSEDF